MGILEVGAIVAGVLGAGAAAFGGSRAADATEDAAETAAGVQNRALDTSIALNRPFTETGVNALNQLNSIFGLPQVQGVDFDNLQGARAGRDALARAAEGLQIIPGATWQGRPVATDGQGNVYGVRGRDGTAEANGFSFIGTAQDGRVQRFRDASGDIKPVKTADGRLLTFSGGEFRSGRQGDVLVPQAVEPSVPRGTVPEGTPPTGVPVQTTLEDLVANNPAIQFRREQGEQAINRAAAASGGRFSGSRLKDFSRFNQGLASEGLQDFVLDPLFELAGFGQRGTSATQNAVTGTAGNLSNIAVNEGRARASAFQNTGNIIGNLGSGISDALLLQSVLRRPPVGASGGGSP